MGGLDIEDQAPITESAPERADVACFVGFVGRRRDVAPSAALRRWLVERGWSHRPTRRFDPSDAADPLLDVPVPIERWEAFDRYFAWEQRIEGEPAAGSTYLGAAVRSFFAQGGRKCYVVRAGDPWTPGRAGDVRRREALARLLPGYPHEITVAPGDRVSWSGIGHLFGMPDVSFLCLPDLADAAGSVPPPPARTIPRHPPPAHFTACLHEDGAAAEDAARTPVAAPRCDAEGYGRWARALQLAAALLRARAREVQLVAAVPLPSPGAEADRGTRGSGVPTHVDRCLAERDLHGFLVASGFLAGPADERSFASAFVQLAYPWVLTPGSARLPEGLEGPEGVVTGILARNALLRGAFRSAARLGLYDVRGVSPVLGREQLVARRAPGERGEALGLLERVSLLGPTPGGLRLLSDVTTSPVAAHRPAAVNRLIAALVRAARRAGEASTFEPSNERTWAALRAQIERVLLRLWDAGALRGETQGEAFTVRCDRTTMTQGDLDAGRLIAEVELDPAVPIERIRVLLTLSEGASLSLAAEGVS